MRVLYTLATAYCFTAMLLGGFASMRLITHPDIYSYNAAHSYGELLAILILLTSVAAALFVIAMQRTEQAFIRHNARMRARRYASSIVPRPTTER